MKYRSENFRVWSSPLIIVNFFFKKRKIFLKKEGKCPILKKIVASNKICLKGILCTWKPFDTEHIDSCSEYCQFHPNATFNPNVWNCYKFQVCIFTQQKYEVEKWPGAFLMFIFGTLWTSSLNTRKIPWYITFTWVECCGEPNPGWYEILPHVCHVLNKHLKINFPKEPQVWIFCYHVHVKFLLVKLRWTNKKEIERMLPFYLVMKSFECICFVPDKD